MCLLPIIYVPITFCRYKNLHLAIIFLIKLTAAALKLQNFSLSVENKLNFGIQKAVVVCLYCPFTEFSFKETRRLCQREQKCVVK